MDELNKKIKKMTNNSFDFSNLIRDVDVKFDTMISQRPSFLGLLGSLGTSINPVTGAPMVKNHKYEWVNDSLGSYSSAIGSFDSDGDGTGINLASTAGLQAGSILRFTSSAGASKTELVKVVSVDSATDLTVSRDYGSTTGVTLEVGDIAYLVATPKNEGSAVEDAIKHEGSIDYNYTQIFSEAANLSKTALASNSYDGATGMAYQLNASMVRMAYNLEDAAIFGVKVQRSSSNAGTMSGVLNQISASGGNIEAAGGNAISQTYLNNVIEDIVADGGALSRAVILCSPNQARKISALNTSGSNPIVYKQNEDRSLGNYVSKFVGDMPIADSGVMASVFTCQRMAKDQIAILDIDQVNLRVMRGLSTVDATTPGKDEYTLRSVAELTLEVKNATKAHGIITGLAL